MALLYSNLCGGLGNQLFQIASSLALSRDYNMSLSFNTSYFNTEKRHPFLASQLFPDLTYHSSTSRFTPFKVTECGPGFDLGLIKD